MWTTCSMRGRNEKCIQNFAGIPQGRYRLGEFVLDGRIILKYYVKL